ncbi:restriction endonuclease subunit S [Vibrio cholerae]|nr:hypothetical protein [Vibrio cholerae]EJL6544966.1 restriction endonuclease subunit S [Vibrio cholerae]EJV7637139.1 restriction endonuclease subunit S [Vibrio cholerae]EKF9149525.1 restriction endonuclease subunit S [Vibrio cholerae]
MSQLPSSWRETPIETVTEVVSGGTPSSKHPEYYTEDHKGSIAWVTPADLSGYKEKYISHGRRSITKSGYDSCSAKLMPKGTVLFSSRAPIGYTVIAANEISTNQGFKSFVPIVGVNETYLYYYLRSIKHLAESLATGTTFKELSGKVAKTLPFPLAPFAEQTRIVEKLDEVLAQVDTIKARLDGIPAILKRFRQSVLAAAVSGKLTEEWRGKNECQSAADLVRAISLARERSYASEIKNGNKETKRLKSKVDKHAPKLPEESLPTTWVWTSFMQSMERVVDCHNKTAPYIEDGIPLIRTPDIRNGKISLSGAMYISQETYDYWSRRCPPASGDIIFTREAPMGEAGIVPENVTLCMGQRMMLLRPLSEYVEPKFVLLNILSLSFQERMFKSAIGTGVKHLRVADVESLSYPLAPIQEQKEIVRLVDQYFAFADTIEAQVKKAQARVDKLTQSILAKAFRGELVPQDPNDEPADKLLERIALARKEAEALAKAAKKAAQK